MAGEGLIGSEWNLVVTNRILISSFINVVSIFWDKHWIKPFVRGGKKTRNFCMVPYWWDFFQLRSNKKNTKVKGKGRDGSPAPTYPHPTNSLQVSQTTWTMDTQSVMANSWALAHMKIQLLVRTYVRFFSSVGVTVSHNSQVADASKAGFIGRVGNRITVPPVGN